MPKTKQAELFGEEAKVRARFHGAEAKARARAAGEELLERVGLLWQMLVDPGHQLTAQSRALVVVALAYFIAPLDVVPDPVPVAGYLDDLLVVFLVLRQIAAEATYRKSNGDE